MGSGAIGTSTETQRLHLFAKCAAFDGPRHAQAVGVYPFFRVIQSAQDPEVTINGRTLVMLGSNNYLGLATDPRVKEAAADAIRRYGTGCCGSRLLNGTLDIHVEFERKLAAFTGKEAAAIFSTGAQVNLGVIACLVDRGDAVYVDKLDHGCIIDGARLAFGETWKFRHNCLDDLRRLMAAGDARGRLVVVDGVFSMEGDIAPLPGIVEIAREFHAAVMVDDAHGIGVLGENGRGTAEHFGVEGQIDLVMGTFSKSLASNGGFVSGGADVINFIRHKARTHIFTAAPVPASVAAASAALDIIGQEPERRELLWRNTRFLSGGLKSLGFDTGNSQTPIIPVIIGEEYRAGAVAMRLQENGVFVNPVVWPATPKGRALIRTSCMATHSEGQLSRALDAFQAVGREFGLIGQ